jgi:hypothetical protein
LVFALIALACGARDRVVPRPLLGRWVCSDARYQGRTLEIAQRALTFASDQTHSESFTVFGVETQDAADGSLHVSISYGQDDGEDRALRLALFPTKPPSLRIGDRSERWSRVPGSEVLR